MSAKRILNSIQHQSESTSHALPVEVVGVALQKSMLSLKGQFLSVDGRGVDYSKLYHSQEFEEYLKNAKNLNHVELGGCSEQERKAFFINVYNALTIHGLSSCDSVPSSVLEVEGFWRNTCYSIGGEIYSLDDIEHGILRCNRPHPSGDVMFSKEDPKLENAMTSLDPRIHFALVCGAKSCPAIQVYSAAKLERGLDLAANSFCEQEVKIFKETKTVTLSKIFQWYSSDFGDSKRNQLKWISQYLPDDMKQTLCDMLLLGDVSVEYSDYNWLLNKL